MVNIVRGKQKYMRNMVERKTNMSSGPIGLKYARIGFIVSIFTTREKLPNERKLSGNEKRKSKPKLKLDFANVGVDCSIDRNIARRD